ncbi:MAG TPA: type II CAAX endopeptidase family protein [Candidatus Limnocylindrales bacterium]|nr:type II CAAX endopeptidase family protein [Candidatus Limnocylindrales bacterium]
MPEEPRPIGAVLPDGSPAPARPAAPGRIGLSTFTIEGRSAPALFVVAWLASLLGLGLVVVGALSRGSVATLGLILAGLLLLSIGLIAAAGSQGIERRARGVEGYAGPSPLLVFASSIPVSILAVVAIGVPLSLTGVALDGPVGTLLSVIVQALVYVALIRLLVVDPGSLDWRAMGIRALDRRAIGEMIGGAFWALPVIVATIPVSLVLLAIFPVTPESPLPPTGEAVGFALSLVAGAIAAPLGEELLFRAFATTAWVRGVGVRQGVLRAAIVYAFAHIITISGTSAGDAIGLAVVGFCTRIPIGLALGWLFVRRGTVWSSFGLHAAFNAVLLIIAEAAYQPI